MCRQGAFRVSLEMASMAAQSGGTPLWETMRPQKKRIGLLGRRYSDPQSQFWLLVVP